MILMTAGRSSARLRLTLGQRTGDWGTILLGLESCDAVIRVYDDVGNVIENTRARGRFQGVVSFYWHHVALPAKTNSHDLHFFRTITRQISGLDRIIPVKYYGKNPSISR